VDWFVNILDIFFKNFACDQKGATAIEYGLIAALISVVIIAALGATGLNTGSLYSDSLGIIGNNISEANGDIE